MAEDVEGLQALLDSMEGLTLNKQKLLIARSLRKAAEPIRRRAAEIAPDDPETPGSSIRDSMSITVSEQTATGAIALIGPTRHGFAGIFAEMGTAHQTAEPFLQPAFDQNVEDAHTILTTELGNGIEKEFAKRR